MEFTEVRELDDIAVYARTMQTRQGLLHNQKSLYSASKVTPKEEATDNVLEYEKILKDTPPNSNENLLNKNPGVLKLIDGETLESLDDLIMTIKTSLEEKNKGENLPVPKKQTSQTNVNWSEGTTESGENEDTDRKDKEVDSQEQKEKKDGMKLFEKVDSEMVSKSYMETKSLKSFLSLGIKGLPSVNRIMVKCANMYSREKVLTI